MTNAQTEPQQWLKRVRGKEKLTIKMGFSATHISVTLKTFSGMDGADLCEIQGRIGLRRKLTGQFLQ